MIKMSKEYVDFAKHLSKSNNIDVDVLISRAEKFAEYKKQKLNISCLASAAQFSRILQISDIADLINNNCYIDYFTTMKAIGINVTEYEKAVVFMQIFMKELNTNKCFEDSDICVSMLKKEMKRIKSFY